MAVPSQEDRFAISDLMTRYTCALDAGEVETVVGCFTEDCELNSTGGAHRRGRQQVREFAQRIARYRQVHGGQFRHVISNIIIDVEHDRARVTCYLLDFLIVDGKSELLSPGTYDCRLRRVDGAWLMQNRMVHLDTPFSGDRWQSP
jgi:uncharacterized protein (TIGR02246 family)